jgi:hypothetical protein
MSALQGGACWCVNECAWWLMFGWCNSQMSFFSSLSFGGKKAEEKKEDKKVVDTSDSGDEDSGEPPLLISEFLAEWVAKERLSDCVFIVGKGKTRIPVCSRCPHRYRHRLYTLLTFDVHVKGTSTNLSGRLASI